MKYSPEAINMEDNISTYPKIISLLNSVNNPIILQNQNKQAFDALYNAIQEIGTITQRGLKDGEKGYKPALKKIMEICRGVE